MIPLLRPAPPYSEVLSMLQLEETKLRTRMEQPQAFYSNNGPRNSGNAAHAPSPQQPAVRPTGVSPNYKGKNPIYRPPKHGGASSSSAPAPGAPPAAPTPPAAPSTPDTSAWSPSHDPWMGLIQDWPMPWSFPAPLGAPPVYPGAWQLGV